MRETDTNLFVLEVSPTGHGGFNVDSVHGTLEGLERRKEEVREITPRAGFRYTKDGAPYYEDYGGGSGD